MEFVLREPILPNETLDYFNVNIPFYDLGINQHKLDNTVFNLHNFCVQTRIYTDKDKISIKSDGVYGYFTVDMISDIVSIQGPMTLYANSITKNTIPLDSITNNSVLNMEELSYIMTREGFLSKIFNFDTIQKKADYPFSNLMSIENLDEILYRRQSEDVSIVSALVSGYMNGDQNIVNLSFCYDNFIPKREPIESISVEGDDITNITLTEGVLSRAEFIEGYQPSSLLHIIPLSYALDCGYSSDPEIESPIYIHNPKYRRTPSNSSFLSSRADEYIKKSDMHARSFYINHSMPGDIGDADIISYDDAKNIISIAFDKLLSPGVDNISDFKKYLSSLCDVSNVYLDKTFTIPGGIVYIGSDCNRMDSIINFDLLSLMIDSKGDFSIGDCPILKASLYFGFSDRDDLNKFAAIAQKLDTPIDIGKNRIGQVYSAIKVVASKICRMSPDIINSDNDPVDVPLYMPEMIFTSPISFRAGVQPYIQTAMAVPIYNKPPFFVIFAPPYVYTLVQPYIPTLIAAPRYIRPSDSISTTGRPVVSTAIIPFSSHTMFMGGIPSFNPYLTEPLRYFKRLDGKVITGAVFSQATMDGCYKSRVDLYRTVNMIDVAAIETKITAGLFFWANTDKKRVILKPQMMSLFLGDVMCQLGAEIDVHMNVDFEVGFHTQKEASPPPPGDGDDESLRSCLEPSATDTSIPYPSKMYGELEWDIGKKTITTDGGDYGDIVVTETEVLQGNPTPNIELDGWIAYGGIEYVAAVKMVVSAIKRNIEEYFSARKTNYAELSEQSVASFDSIQGSIECAMLEYIDIKNTTLGPEYEYEADPLGIFDSNITMECTPVSDIVPPYQLVMLNGDLSGINPDEYKKNPPPIKGGDNRIRIWVPSSTPGEVWSSELKAISIASDNKGTVSTFGDVVYIHEPKEENGRYEYFASGVTVNVSTTDRDGEAYYVLGASISGATNRVILGKVAESPAPIKSDDPVLCQDFHDWVSPYTAGGGGTMGSFGGTGIVGSASEDKPVTVCSTTVQQEGDEPTCSSLIDPSKVENISDLSSIFVETGEQEYGEVPASITIPFNLILSKLRRNGEDSEIYEEINKTMQSIELTMGCIDGLQNIDGDVLSQGLSQLEIDDMLANNELAAVTYICPNSVSKEILSLTRVPHPTIQNKKIGSLFTVDMDKFINEKLVLDGEDCQPEGKPFGEYEDEDGFPKKSEILMNTMDMDDQEISAEGLVLVESIGTPGYTSAFKHAGPNPKKPIVIGYNGSAEMSLFDKDRVVGTTPSRYMKVIHTYGENIFQAIYKNENESDHVIIFITDKDIKIYVKDVYAPLSQNRVLKVIH